MENRRKLAIAICVILIFVLMDLLRKKKVKGYLVEF